MGRKSARFSPPLLNSLSCRAGGCPACGLALVVFAIPRFSIEGRSTNDVEVIQPVCNHSSHNHSNDLADLTFCVSNLAQRQGCGVSLVKPSTVFKPLHQCHLLQGASLD